MQKRYCCEVWSGLSRGQAIGIASLLLVSGASFADGAKEVEVQPYKLAIRGDGKAIVVQESGSSLQVQCAVKGIKGPNGVISALTLNSQKDAVILTDVDFVRLDDLIACKSGVVKVTSIPANVDGFLVDVNLRAGIYLALGLENSPPPLYLATVAKFGSSKSLVRLPGSSLGGSSKTAFTYVELKPGRISASGRYVAPSGVIECDEDSYPGVWDLVARVRVVIPATGERKKAERQCRELFD